MFKPLRRIWTKACAALARAAPLHLAVGVALNQLPLGLGVLTMLLACAVGGFDGAAFVCFGSFFFRAGPRGAPQVDRRKRVRFRGGKGQ